MMMLKMMNPMGSMPVCTLSSLGTNSQEFGRFFLICLTKNTSNAWILVRFPIWISFWEAMGEMSSTSGFLWSSDIKIFSIYGKCCCQQKWLPVELWPKSRFREFFCSTKKLKQKMNKNLKNLEAWLPMELWHRIRVVLSKIFFLWSCDIKAIAEWFYQQCFSQLIYRKYICKQN